MKLTFQLGFALVCIGLAIGAGANYLGMRQFETGIPGMASAGWEPTDASVIYQSLKANDDFSKKNFSPDISMHLLRDYSFMGQESKQQFQHIRDSVSKKKSDALHCMNTFLFLAALMGFSHNSMLRKARLQPPLANTGLAQ
jgi:hypothetical protein